MYPHVHTRIRPYTHAQTYAHTHTLSFIILLLCVVFVLFVCVSCLHTLCDVNVILHVSYYVLYDEYINHL